MPDLVATFRNLVRACRQQSPRNSASQYVFLACFTVTAAVLTAFSALSARPAEEKPLPYGGFSHADIAERMNVTIDDAGNLHWGPRTIPPPYMASPELRKAYIARVKQDLARLNTGGTDTDANRQRLIEDLAKENAAMNAEVLKTYPVNVEDTELAGVKVSIFTPKNIPPRNKNRVVMEFEVPAEGMMVASIGQMKVMSVRFTVRRGADGDYDLRNIEDQVVSVYRELLKTHKSSQIAMFGLSGGCQLAANTSVWLAQIKLPLPSALGLMTCAGGAKPGDTRITLDGLDPALSTIGVPGGRLDQGAEQARNYYATKKPEEPPREILDAEIPKGFPPSYLLSGTRNMSLSHMALLHRKLRHAGVEADLNVFEGLWHGGSTILIPEAKDALTDFAGFLDKHMGT